MDAYSAATNLDGFNKNLFVANENLPVVFLRLVQDGVPMSVQCD